MFFRFDLKDLRSYGGEELPRAHFFFGNDREQEKAFTAFGVKMGILLLSGPVNHSAIAWIKHGVFYGRTDRRTAGEVQRRN